MYYLVAEAVNEIGSFITTEFVCEHSRDFFEKLEHGCYGEFFGILMFILCSYIFVRVFVWLLTKVFG